MSQPSEVPPGVRLRLPDGREVHAPPDAILGRSPAATVRIDDPRVSTVHAELSFRDEGPVLISRGGRLRVDGRAVREVVLAAGLRVELAPSVAIEVLAVHLGGLAPVPPTAGRERLRFQVRDGEVRIHRGADVDPLLVLTGISARIVEELLGRRGSGARWGEIAEAVWSEEAVLRRRLREQGRMRVDDWTAVDERRFRNRWDQALRLVRQSVEPIRGGGFIDVEGGVLALKLAAGDLVETEGRYGEASMAMRNPIDQA